MAFAQRFLGLALLITSGWAQAAQLVSVSPQGHSPNLRQVTARFSEDMIRLGAGDQTVAQQNAFTLSCNRQLPASQGRWIDTRTYVVDFAQPLPPGFRCTPQLAKDLKSLAGKVVTASVQQAITTGGVRLEVLMASGTNEYQLSEKAVLIGRTNAPISTSVLESALRCETEDAPNKQITVDVLPASQATALYKKRFGEPTKDQQAKIFAMRCNTTLPNSRKVVVRLSKDAAYEGVSEPADQTLEFHVRPTFYASVSCTALYPKPLSKGDVRACDPRDSINADFSYGVNWEQARKIKLTRPDGSAIEPNPSQEGNYDDESADGSTQGSKKRLVRRISFKGFGINASGVSLPVTLNLPSTLTDIDGRQITEHAMLPKTIAFSAVPPYSGMMQTQAIVPTTVTQWPIAVRNVERGLAVNTWQLNSQHANADITLIKLLDRQNKGEHLTASDFIEGVWAKRATQVSTNGGALQMVGLPLQTTGVSALAIDSPIYQSHVAKLQPLAEPYRPAPSPASGQTALIQRSNLNVQLKLGQDGPSIIWVTSFDLAAPQADVKLAAYGCDFKPLWQGQTDAAGLANVADALLAAPQCEETKSNYRSHNNERGVWIVAKRNGDMQAIKSSHIRTYPQAQPTYTYWGGDPRNGSQGGVSIWPNMANPTVAHTILDRALFKPGETVHMQHIIRKFAASGFKAGAGGDASVVVRFAYNEVIATLPIKIDANGEASHKYSLPANAKLGQYSVGLQKDGQTVANTTFKVEEYRTPIFDANLSTRDQWVNKTGEKTAVQQIAHDLSLSFMAGGAAGGLATQLKFAHDENYPKLNQAYDFGSASSELAPLRVTLPKPAKSMPITLDAKGKAQYALPAAEAAVPYAVASEMQFADPNGEIQTVSARATVWPGDIKFGMQFRNAGKKQPLGLQLIALDRNNKPTANHRFTLSMQSARYVQTGPMARRGELELIGQPKQLCAGASDTKGEARCDWNRAGEADDVDSNDVNKQPPSHYLFTVEWQDTRGKALKLNVLENRWSLGWRAIGDDTQLIVEPVSGTLEAVKPGDVLQVTPKPKQWPAYMLVTMEREGVLASQVFHAQKPSDRFNVTLPTSSSPNVQVAARYIYPLADQRVSDARIAEVDGTLGSARGTVAAARKPARSVQPQAQDDAPQLMSEQSLALKVSLARFTLNVDVKPDRAEARPKSTVSVRVTAKNMATGQLARNARVTLVSVDDGLLALMPNHTWKVLQRFLVDRNVTVNPTSSDQRVWWSLATNPKQWFGERPEYLPHEESMMRAALLLRTSGAMDAPPPPPESPAAAMAPIPARARASTADLAPIEKVEVSGSRIARNMLEMSQPVTSLEPQNKPRSDFNSLLLWRADVKTDANGIADVPLPLNDSLTRVRIVAFVFHEADQFGEGQATLQVTQPLQLYSGLPVIARQGDVIRQTATVRNSSSAAMNVRFVAQPQLEPLSAIGAKAELASHEERIALAAGESRVIGWTRTLPARSTMKWKMTAQTTDRKEVASDTVEIEQTLLPRLRPTVRMATLLALDQPNKQVPVGLPKDSLSTEGSALITFQSSLVEGALSEARRWMSEYPYPCFEQRASAAVVRGDRKAWDALMNEIDKHQSTDGYLRYFPEASLNGSESLTIYILNIAHAMQWSIPDLARAKMLAALKRESQSPLDWAPSAYQIERKLAAQAALANYNEKVAKPTELTDLTRLPAQSLVDWIVYLMSSEGKGTTASVRLSVASSALLARFDTRGTAMRFTDEARENCWWFMWSGDVAAARVALIAQSLAQHPATSIASVWKDERGRVVNGLVGRQKDGRYGTTTGNAWATATLTSFAKQFESVPVTGTTRVQSPSIKLAQTVDWAVKADKANVAKVVAVPIDAKDPNASVQFTHQGTGQPWATVAVLAMVEPRSAIYNGLQVKRTVTAVEQKTQGQWAVGDVMRVRLEMEANSAVTWVVVRDGVPSGATILGRGLGRESGMAQRGEQSGGWAWPSYIERGAESYRAYYRWVPQGKWTSEYTVRLNNAGEFKLPPVRIEAMYAPDMFGEAPAQTMVVKE